MSVKLTNKDYAWSYAGVVMSMCSQALLLPFVLYFLNSEMYGLWSVFQSVAAVTTLFDFGFSTTFARNINYCWCGAKELKKSGVIFSEKDEPNFRLMKQTMEVCRFVFLLISMIALLIMATIGTAYIHYISRDISGNEPMIAWVFYLMAIFLNLYYGYYSSFLRGVGAISEVNRSTVVARCAQIVLTIAFLICGFGVIGTGLAYMVYGLLFRIYSRRCFLKFHEIGKNLERIHNHMSRNHFKKLFEIVWYNAGREGVVTLSNYLANQACTIICSLFMSLSVTGVYSLAVQLATAISNISGALYTANQPVLQAAYISGDKKKTKSIMSLIVYSYVLIFIVGMVAVLTVGIPLLTIIKPESKVPMSLMCAIGLYQFVLKFRNCYTSYFSCTNRIPYMKAFIISSISCVILALAFMGWFHLGVWGLVAAQLISQCVYNVWNWTIKAHREMELGFTEMFRLGSKEFNNIFAGVIKKGRRYERSKSGSGHR